MVGFVRNIPYSYLIPLQWFSHQHNQTTKPKIQHIFMCSMFILRFLFCHFSCLVWVSHEGNKNETEAFSKLWNVEKTRCNSILRCLHGGGGYMNWKKKGNIIEIKCMCGQSAIKKAQPLQTPCLSPSLISVFFSFPFYTRTHTQTLTGVRKRNYGFSQVYVMKSIKVT